MERNLTERKLRILKFIIEEYIKTAEPVGSRTISKNRNLGVSAATIRNEMADLEELGFLNQPHVSSGRVPSSKAYGLYVEELMKVSDIINDDADKLFEIYKLGTLGTRELLSDTLNLLSDFTSMISLGVSGAPEHLPLKIIHFDLVDVGAGKLIMLLVTDDGSVRNLPIICEEKLDNDKLALINSTLKEQIVGKKIDSIDENLANYVKSKISEYSELIDKLLLNVKEKRSKGLKVIFSGATNIFDYPEFNDMSLAKSFLSMLENEEEVIELMSSKGLEKNGVNIVIGDESKGEVMENLSMLTIDFGKDAGSKTRIGIIGPRRMNYEKVFSLLNYLTHKVNNS